MTSTSVLASSPPSIGAVAFARTSKSRRSSASAALASEASAGWDACIRSATSVRIDHDSECASSKRTRARLLCSEVSINASDRPLG